MFKGMVGIIPSEVAFVSTLFPGSVSDKALSKKIWLAAFVRTRRQKLWCIKASMQGLVGLNLFNDDTRPSGHISRPTQVNVSQSCFHSLKNYSSPIILSSTGIGLDWICLTTTHVLKDILAVLHKWMFQNCFHSLNNYSSPIILSSLGASWS